MSFLQDTSIELQDRTAIADAGLAYADAVMAYTVASCDLAHATKKAMEADRYITPIAECLALKDAEDAMREAFEVLEAVCVRIVSE